MSKPKVVGVVAWDETGASRIPSQAELDAGIALQKPVIDAFYRVPGHRRGDILVSLIASWCLSYPDPEDAFAALGEEASATINRALVQQQERRQ